MSSPLEKLLQARKIMIQSKLVCFKCGGIGHKSNVCPSVSDADYRKPRHTTGRGSSGSDDEFRTQNRPSVHGNVWVASTSRVPDGFYLDSGATLHVTCQKELLHDFSDSSGSITGLDSGTSFEIAGKGTLNFSLPDGSFLTLTDVQYVPSCDRC